MAQLSTFATTASNVSVDSDTRNITIQNEVVEIDGVLDPPTGFADWSGWTITCSSSGGLRSVAGASGTLGGGVHSLKIVEKTNAHRYAHDNLNTRGAARFAGDATNVMKYHNIVWIVETGGRSDFDIDTGAQTSGSAGPKVEFSGVSLYQLTESGQDAHFNHYSGQASIRIHPQLGFGMRIENRTNGTGIEFSTPIHDGAVIEGLVIANVTPTSHPNGARVAYRLARVSHTLTLSNLNTPSIAAVSEGTNTDATSANKVLRLVDPVGRPTRVDWSSKYVGIIDIRRHVPFIFTGDPVPASTTLNADAQASSNQLDATAVVSGTGGSILLRTDISLPVIVNNNPSSHAWSTPNTYKFYMTALGIRKYALTDTQTIGNEPTAITAAIRLDGYPDDSLISSVAEPAACDNLDDIIRALKEYEADNPTADPSTPLAYVDGTSIKINTGYNISLVTTGDIVAISGTTISIKCGTTLSVGSKGLTTLDASGDSKTITTSGVSVDDDVFLLDSTGQKTRITIVNSMGASCLFSVVDTSDGSVDGTSTISSGGSGTITLDTKGLTTGYRVVAKRPGYRYFSYDIDLTGGGLISLTAPVQEQILQPNGIPSYVTGASTTDLDVADTSSAGSIPAMRVGLGDTTFTAMQVFKSIEDFLATSAGARFMGQGGQQPIYINDSLKGDQIYFGGHCKVRRHATTNHNAKVRASLFANDGEPVDGTRGSVQTIEGLDVPALAKKLFTIEDLDSSEVGTQSVYGKLTAIETAVGGIESLTTAQVADAVAGIRLWGDARDVMLTGVQTSVFIHTTTDGLSTGDRVYIVNNGGMSGLNQGAHYYAYVPSSGFFYLYNTRDDAFLGVDDHRVMVSGGVIGDLSFTFQSPGANIRDALGDILADTTDLNGDDFAETGYSLADVQRIILSILIGRLNITNDSGTLTFHRVDADETAIIRTNVSDIGRTAPTRDPT